MHTLANSDAGMQVCGSTHLDLVSLYNRVHLSVIIRDCYVMRHSLFAFVLLGFRHNTTLGAGMVECRD